MLCLQLQTEAVKAFATQKQARDKRMAELKRHAAGVAAGGKHAEEVLKKLATMQASLPQAEQALVQAPRAIMNFPALKGRPHSALNGSSEKSAKKKAKEAPRAELQRTQMKNPIQVGYRNTAVEFAALALHPQLLQYVVNTCMLQQARSPL